MAHSPPHTWHECDAPSVSPPTAAVAAAVSSPCCCCSPARLDSPPCARLRAFHGRPVRACPSVLAEGGRPPCPDPAVPARQRPPSLSSSSVSPASPAVCHTGPPSFSPRPAGVHALDDPPCCIPDADGAVPPLSADRRPPSPRSLPPLSVPPTSPSGAPAAAAPPDVDHAGLGPCNMATLRTLSARRRRASGVCACSALLTRYHAARMVRELRHGFALRGLAAPRGVEKRDMVDQLVQHDVGRVVARGPPCLCVSELPLEDALSQVLGVSRQQLSPPSRTPEAPPSRPPCRLRRLAERLLGLTPRGEDAPPAAPAPAPAPSPTCLPGSTPSCSRSAASVLELCETLTVGCRNGLVPLVQQVLAGTRGIDVVSAWCPGGAKFPPAATDAPPLVVAAVLGHVAVVEVLVSCPVVAAAHTPHGGVVRGCVDHRGESPLHAACRAGRTAVVDLLLAVQPEAATLPPAVLLPAAAPTGDADTDADEWAPPMVPTVPLAGATALFSACVGGSVEVVRMLAAAGACVTTAVSHAVHDCRVSPLWVAAEHGHLPLVQLLLAAGCDVNVSRASDGATALWIACANRHTQVAATLVAAGANVHAATSNHGLSPVHVATATGNAPLAALLVSVGARTDVPCAPSAGGGTAVAIAAASGLPRVAGSVLLR